MWLKDFIVLNAVILWCIINNFQFCKAKASVFTESKHSELFDDTYKDVKDIDNLELNKSINFAKQLVDSIKRLEINLDWSDIHVSKESPSYGQLKDSEPTEEALAQNKEALIASKVTGHLINLYCSKIHAYFKECASDVFNISLINTPLSASCQTLLDACTERETKSPYYSADGTCNNKIAGSFGKSSTAYKRLLPANYVDLVEELRTRSVKSKKILPSPRLISTTLCKKRNIEDSELTLAVMQWSQFIEHDLAYTATNKMVHFNKTIECCEANGTYLLPRYKHPFCLPISIPVDDPFYGKYGVECMSYVRSVIATKSDCKLGAIQQMNQATHYLDGSQIYGSDVKSSRSLRLFKRGLLKFREIRGFEYLPLSEYSLNDQSNYFISGDIRVNFQPQLTTMHILWFREHNRIAMQLSRINPNWDDETLYQESRRIVIAEMQHITYYNWLPVILGERRTMNVQKRGKYAVDVDARVTNSFATAGLKFVNSLMADELKLYSDNRTQYQILSLKDYFYKPLVVEEADHLDGLIRGLATQLSLKLDLDYAGGITTHLYKTGNYGYDIMSLDIQRGRDHGLPSYTSMRRFCGLSEVRHFNNLSTIMLPQTIVLLTELYSSPQDIDLLVGGMSEKPDEDSVLGPTLSCIIAEQFERTKGGDRFFYDNQQQPKPFTKEQLREIKKASLARIFCDNGNDIGFMQPNVFKRPNKSNSLVSCIDEVIPFINLNKWKVTPEEQSYST